VQQTGLKEAFDPNDGTNKKVWAGGVTGGLWYNNDITNAASSWINVDDFWANIAITSIASDPNNSQIFYVGTGEGWGCGSSRGAGIWKSTDGGSNWAQLSATTTFYYVNDLIVRNESGSSVIYAGVSAGYYQGKWHSTTEGLYRSTNGGGAFTQVLPAVPSGSGWPYAAADLELGADNRIWVGTRRVAYASTQASGSGSGTILYSDNGTAWTTCKTVADGARVEVACAPSDADVVYAVVQDESPAVKEQDVITIIRSGDKGGSWTTKAVPVSVDGSGDHFTRSQAWYDLIIAVHPTTPNTLIIGGIDLHKSTDGGSSWTGISHWYGGYSKPEVHADQHCILFRPDNVNNAVIGNDGGIYYSADLGNASSPAFTVMNSNYNVTQFYSCAADPTSGSNYFLGGTQDNGSQRFNNAGVNSTTEVTGGDGGFCFIDQTDANYQITTYVYNSIWVSQNGGASFFRPVNDKTTGLFINPGDYDNNQDILFSCRTTTTIHRLNDVSGTPAVDFITITGMNSKASHIRVSPYTTASSTIYVGTQAGDLYKVTNANTGSPTTTSISGASFPNGNLSCVEIGANENELLVTFSNYNVNSIWYTNNGGTSWVSKENDLPDMPVRWAVFNPLNRNEVLLATEIGVWKSLNFNDASPNWTSSTSGLANVRVDMLQVRSSDNAVVAATHGRGFFTGEFTYGPVRLQAKVFLEGAYSVNDDNMSITLKTDGVIPLTSPYSEDNRTVNAIPTDITDWVLVQLRSTKTGAAVVSRSAFLHKDGRIVADDGSTSYIELNVATADYYIVVQHRNHLAVMSDEIHSLSMSSSTLYDFTTGTDKYEGADAILLETRVYGLYAGDGSHNQQIQNDDNNDYWRVQVGLAGYRSADYDLNGQVQNTDINDLWAKNTGKGTQVSGL